MRMREISTEWERKQLLRNNRRGCPHTHFDVNLISWSMTMEKLAIPPEFSSYAEEKGIFTLYEGMLEALLTTKPESPLQFLIHYLSVDRSQNCRVVVYGPPCSGQHSICKAISRKLRAVHIVPKRVLKEDQSVAGSQARELTKEGKEIPPSLWAEMILSRTQQTDCQDKGWVLEAFPRTREQALAIQSEGVTATHFVHLECPDTVLIERYGGKRVDPLTGDVYHLVFSPPTNDAVAGRLVEEEGGIDVNLHNPLETYHRHSHSLRSSYSPTITSTFNADQPLSDLITQVHDFLCSRKRSPAPHTPKVVLLGPCGSGKSVQAINLAQRYNLINVDCEELVKQELVSGSSLADQIRPFIENNMIIPDDMVLSLVTRRLSCLDCTSRGWVLHGFPITGNQAELLSQAGFRPTRVFFLNVCEETIKERLTLRRVDPFSGESYHLLMKPPPSQEILNRLVTYPHDTEERVTERLESYREFVQELEDVYQRGQHVHADLDPLTVFEVIESLLVNPLPIPRPAPLEN